MKILFVVYSLDAGGVTTATNALARHFVLKGHEVSLLSLEHTSARPKECDSSLPRTVHVASLPNTKKSARFFIQAFAQLIRYFTANRAIDQVIIASPYPAIVTLAALKLTFHRAATLVNFHTHVSSYAANEPWGKRLILSGGRYLLRLADSCANVSQEAARDAALFFRLKRVDVLYNPLGPYVAPPGLAAALPHPWFGDPSLYPIIACGRLTQVKDYPLMLRAFKSLSEQDSRYRLIILGDGELASDLHTLADRLGVAAAVHFAGKAANPRDYMHCSRFLWLTSRYEGFPMAMVEALSAGIPCVAVDCLSGPREILADGAYGLLLDTRAPDDIARAVHIFAQMPAQPRAHYQQRARDFDVETVANAYLLRMKKGGS